MRRTVLALLAVTALVSACQQPADAPAGDAAPASATPPEMPADAPPQEEVDPAVIADAPADPGSCLAERGEAAAAQLVERCIAVSPATRPPCNLANSCDIIQDEIDRACEMYGPGDAKPAQCGA